MFFRLMHEEETKQAVDVLTLHSEMLEVVKSTRLQGSHAIRHTDCIALYLPK